MYTTSSDITDYEYDDLCNNTLLTLRLSLYVMRSLFAVAGKI